MEANEVMHIECGKSAECGPYKHHYDECVERVTSQMEEGDGKAKENCVEECKYSQPPTILITHANT
jgi:hypothetical protein